MEDASCSTLVFDHTGEMFRTGVMTDNNGRRLDRFDSLAPHQNH
jgi:hypothetical protein